MPPSIEEDHTQRLYGFQVDTGDMDAVFPIGSVLDVFVAPPVDLIPDHKAVIVLRTNPQGLQEVICRELRREDDGTMWLWPRSKNPRYQEPFIYRDGSNEVRIIGTVNGLAQKIDLI